MTWQRQKIILSATDAGGVRNLAPLAPVCISRGLTPVLVTTSSRLGLFNPERIPEAEVRPVDRWEGGDLAGILAEERPLACICGTTRYDSPDRRLTLIAKATGVRAVVVLDEWFNYRLRFEDPKSGELVYLPDAVALQDQQAKEEAVAEGIPAAICHLTGSPALADLTRQAQSLAAAPPGLPEVLAEAQGRPVITFLSETHAADYGTGPDSPGALGAFIGYTEIMVRQAILEVLGSLGRPVLLVEKLHPAAQETTTDRSQIPGNVDFHSTSRTALWPLLWYSDLVIGMRSMALLEAHILGCETWSFQPGLLGPELGTAVRLGLIPKIKGQAQLQALLSARLAKTKKAARKIHQYPFARPDAAERVVNLALERSSPS